jgi:hypothetical protein
MGLLGVPQPWPRRLELEGLLLFFGVKCVKYEKKCYKTFKLKYISVAVPLLDPMLSGYTVIPALVTRRLFVPISIWILGLYGLNMIVICLIAFIVVPYIVGFHCNSLLSCSIHWDL